MTEQHPDLDALADLLAGQAPDEAHAHVAGCASCTAALRELESALVGVQASLAGLPDPELPAEVAARLDRVRPTAPSATVVPEVTSLSSRRRPGWLMAGSGIAAAAVLLLGGVLGASLLRDSADEATTEDAALGGVGATKGIATSSTGNDYAKDGSLLQNALPGLLSSQTPAFDSSVSPRESAPLATDGLARLRDPAVLADCLTALSDPEDEGIPLALDYASFEGAPALVVVLPAPSAQKVDVFVVGAGCSQADAQVLLFNRLPRP